MRNRTARPLATTGVFSRVTIRAVSSASETPLLNKWVASAVKRTRAAGRGACSVMAMMRLTDNSSVSLCCTMPLGQRRESTETRSALPMPNRAMGAS